MAVSDENTIYKKQIVLIGSKTGLLENELKENGYLVKGCSFSISEIMLTRDCSNILILYTTNEDEEDLKRICLYLRDMCIEEDKILYIYGNKTGVDLIRSVIPSIFVRKSSYLFTEPFAGLIEDLNKLTYHDGVELPGLLIVDDDIEYISKLRPYLDDKFQIYVCHLDLKKAVALLNISDILLINSEASFTLYEFVEFFKATSARKKRKSFHFYYLTQSDEQRDRINSGLENSSIALSKSVAVEKTASFLRNNFSA